MQTQPLSQADEQQLDTWLLSDQTPVGTWSLATVKGFFFALVSSPDPIEVDQWMPMIFAGHQQVDIEDDKLFALLAVYNAIGDAVYSNEGALPAEITFSSPVRDNFDPGHGLHQWSVGFSQGVGFYNDKLLDALPQDEEITEAYSIALINLSFFADWEMALAVVNMQEEVDIEGMGMLIFELIEEIIPDFAQLVEQAAIATGLYDDEEEPW